MESKTRIPVAAGMIVALIEVAWRASPLLLGLGILTEILVGLSVPVAGIGLGLLAEGLAQQLRGMTMFGVGLLACGVGFQWILGGIGARLRLGLMEKTGFHYERTLVDAVCGLQVLDLLNDPEFQNRLFLARDQVARAGHAINILINALSSLARSLATVGILLYLDQIWLALVVMAAVMGWSSMKAAALVEQAQTQGGQYQRQARQLVDAVMDVDVAAQVRIWNAAQNIRTVVGNLYRQGILPVKQAALRGLALKAATTVLYMGTFAGLILLTMQGGQVRTSVLVTLIVLGAQLSGILYGLSQTTGIVRGSLEAIKRVRDVEETIRQSTRLAADALTAPAAEGIRFEQVAFAYQEAAGPALQDLELYLRPGEVVGIVGDNGAGKSTFVSLLLNLFRPTAGRIVGGAGKAGAAVLQDYLRPELQLQDAVGLGSMTTQWSAAQVRCAMEKAGVGSLLGSTGSHLDTQLGPQWGGRDFSGGQWQQLALGRAMMRSDADVLVLDEPTASISPDREHEMLQGLRNIIGEVHALGSQVVVVVSHRLALMKSVDRILVFRDGRIVEDGTHATLMAIPGGNYRHQFEQQSACYA